MGNANRIRGVGRGAGQVWQGSSLEAGPENAPVVESLEDDDNQDWLEGDYIELIRDYYKNLFFENDSLKRVLEENGLKALERWVKETGKLLEKYDITEECLRHTIDVLAGKYRGKAEELEAVILENRLGEIPEIKSETTKAILVYYEQSLEGSLERTKNQRNKELISAQLRKVRNLLGEGEDEGADNNIPPAAGLEVDKTGENKELKDLRAKIKEEFQQALKENLERIDRLATERESSVNKTKLEQEKEKIKNQITRDLEGHAGIILHYLGKEYKSSYVGRLIRTAVRRTVANLFANGNEIRKILPEGKISWNIVEDWRAKEASPISQSLAEKPQKEEKIIAENINYMEKPSVEEQANNPAIEIPTGELLETGRSVGISRDNVAQTFTPDDVFWRQNREEMVSKLAKEINRISWLNENEVSAQTKIIPEIDLDLRAEKIRSILEKEFRGVKPGTEESHEIITQLHRMWAEKWLDYLEKQRWGAKRYPESAQARPVVREVEKKKEIRIEKDVMPKEGGVPVTANTLHSSAETPRAREDKKIEQIKRELTEEQKQLLKSIAEKAKIVEIESKFPAVDVLPSEPVKERWTHRKRSLELVKTYLEEIVRKNAKKDVEVFRDGILAQFLNEYRRIKKEKESEKRMEEKEMKEFREDILGRMESALRKEFGDNATTMVNYFRNIFNIEFLVKNSK